MKAQFTKRICKKYLLPNLSGLNIKGNLLYYKDFQYLLRGFSFESSAFSRNSFSIEVFVQPLFVPTSSLVFNFGNRLGFLASHKDVWWTYDESQEEIISNEILKMMVNFGVPFLEKRETIEKFLYQYKGIGMKDNRNMYEAICYAQILAGNYAKSNIMLRSFEIILSQDISQNPKIKWLEEILARVQIILQCLNSKDYASAIHTLNEWRDLMLATIGLR